MCAFADILSRFPLADVLWTFAMALDVYLVVFYHFDGRALKSLEIPYVVAITTLTFIPALVFLFIRTSARGSIYGSAIVSTVRKMRKRTLDEVNMETYFADLVCYKRELDASSPPHLLCTRMV